MFIAPPVILARFLIINHQLNGCNVILGGKLTRVVPLLHTVTIILSHAPDLQYVHTLS